MEVTHCFNGNAEHNPKIEKDGTERREGEVCPTQGLEARLHWLPASFAIPLTSLQRYIPFLPTIAFDATLQSSWEALSVSFQAGLLNGGPVRNPPNSGAP